ncbi:MAG TPA: hypothetical protein VKD70_10280 [Candidatus Acidoferrum sp.]|nr:hypothetical protein [Candidatus Acidoferrum sp.]
MITFQRLLCRTLIQLSLLLYLAPAAFSQMNPGLQTYFKQYVELKDDQIASIRSGQAVAKILHSRKADEIYVFGAVYINADPEAYLKFSRDFDRLRALPGYLALDRISTPPQPSEFKGFEFDSEDVKDLKNCKPGKCEVQLPATRIEQLQKTTDWSAPDADQQITRILQKTAVERIAAYQKQGNVALGTYGDKKETTDVAEQFKYMLTFSKALPDYLPDFYNYLLSYPNGPHNRVEDTFYWAKVKFGLKPTLRVIHVLTYQGIPPNEPVYTVAEKQLYSSHYFQTALDLTFCVVDAANPHAKGFYLIKVLGSEQAGLTGFKGSIVRKVAVDRSASSLQKSLAAIKTTLEQNP